MVKTTVDPMACGIAGFGSMHIYFADSDTHKIIDFHGRAPLANVPFFGIAFVASVVIAFASGSRLADFAKFTHILPVLLSAGVMSAGLIIGSAFLIPKIGLGSFGVLLVAGQILAGLAFGQIEIFGIEPQQLSLAKVAGAVMMSAGVYLVSAAG